MVKLKQPDVYAKNVKLSQGEQRFKDLKWGALRTKQEEHWKKTLWATGGKPLFLKKGDCL